MYIIGIDVYIKEPCRLTDSDTVKHQTEGHKDIVEHQTEGHKDTVKHQTEEHKDTVKHQTEGHSRATDRGT